MRDSVKDWLQTGLLIATLIGSVSALGMTIGSLRSELRAYNKTTQRLEKAVTRLSERVDVQTNKDAEQDARLEHHWDILQILRRYHDLQ